MGNRAWKDQPEKTNEYNLPTEPLPPLVPSPPQSPIVLPAVPEAIPGSPPYEHTYSQPYMPTVPATAAYEQGYPQSYMPTAPVVPPYPYNQKPALTGTYPYLPQAPVSQQGGREQVPGQPARSATPSSRSHNRAIPFFIGFCFVIIQLLLLVRFGSKLINLPDSLGWTGPVYALSDIFVAPFRSLIQPYLGGIPASIELYTLLAVFVYGTGSRLLVRFLKAVL